MVVDVDVEVVAKVVEADAVIDQRRSSLLIAASFVSIGTVTALAASPHDSNHASHCPHSGQWTALSAVPALHSHDASNRISQSISHLKLDNPSACRACRLTYTWLSIAIDRTY
jgi:hypothetical protein